MSAGAPGTVLDGENVGRSEEHTSELQSQSNLVCRLLLEKKKKTILYTPTNPQSILPHTHMTATSYSHRNPSMILCTTRSLIATTLLHCTDNASCTYLRYLTAKQSKNECTRTQNRWNNGDTP